MKDGKPASKISADKKQKAAERRKSHHPVSLGANASGVWNDDIRAQAVEYLKGKIQEQQEKVKEFETLIEHTTSFIAARLHSENNIGAVLSMKQVLKYESMREQAARSVHELESILAKVQASTSWIDYQSKVDTILTVPAPVCRMDDREELLAEAKSRLKPVELHQQGSRAA